jgi:inhibitor of the pro-sigma K processing machinery
MHVAIVGLFILSLTGLLWVLIRNKESVQWLTYVGINVLLAAVLLYAVNGLGSQSGFHVPINLITLSIVGVLGVPGVVMLVILKATLF